MAGHQAHLLHLHRGRGLTPKAHNSFKVWQHCLADPCAAGAHIAATKQPT